jgi:predicted nucleotidyltransferase
MNAALLAELLGGTARYKALQCLYGQAERRFGTRELAAAAGIDPGNASRWLRRWADVGLVERVTERGHSLFRASLDPDLAPLRHLLQRDSEAARVLRQALGTLNGDIVAAAIFGSVARGDTGVDSDIDLLLVSPDLSALEAQAHFKPAGRKLGRPVNVQVFTPHDWRDAVDRGDPFVRDLRENPLVHLIPANLQGL